MLIHISLGQKSELDLIEFPENPDIGQAALLSGHFRVESA